MEIAELLGQPVPDRPDYRFGGADEVTADGDFRRVPIYRVSDDEHVGEAEGTTAEELVRTARAAADSDALAQE